MGSVQFSLIHHLIHPFSVKEQSDLFTLRQKVATVAAALFAGIAAAYFINRLVGVAAGFTLFYALTAYEKMSMLALFKEQHPPKRLAAVNPADEGADKLKIDEVIQPRIQKAETVSDSAKPTLTQPVYNTAKNCFEHIDPQAAQKVKLFQRVLEPADQKNIQRVVRFGDWQGMDLKIEMPLVKQGKEFRLYEKIATELPELGNYIFLNKRGNGECGYRTLADGVIYGDCILSDHVEELKQSFQKAFDHLIDSWNDLPFSPEEKGTFETSKFQSFVQLDRMKGLDKESRIALLQDEAFLAPVLTLIRCIVVSQTKFIETSDLPAQALANTTQINDLLDALRKKIPLEDKERELISYALANYSLDLLLSDAELPDRHGNDGQNKNKDKIRSLVQRANEADHQLLKQLKDVQNGTYELSNKENILATPLPEYLDLGITMDEFLKRKALGNADSPRSLWALASDFTALGYALDKNICCIFRDAFKDNVYDVVKTFRDQPPYFYGINMTSQAHYNALLPLVPNLKNF